MFDSNPATNILAGDGFPNSDLVATLITYPAILPQISPWIQIWTWQIWQLYPHLGMSKDRVPPNPIADNHCSPCLGHPPIFDKGTHFWLPKNPAPRRSSVWRSGLRRKAKSKRPNPCWPWPGRPGKAGFPALPGPVSRGFWVWVEESMACQSRSFGARPGTTPTVGLSRLWASTRRSWRCNFLFRLGQQSWDPG